ncbi:MAG: hypothetical protein AAGB46_09950 [Verrucomicrobiota bacterium]
MDFNTNYRIALLEIQQVVDAEKLIGIDLLDDDPILLEVHSPSLAAFVPRFDRILTFLYPYDNYWRAAGRIVQFEPIPTIDPVDALTQLCQHQGYKSSDDPKAWIEDHFETIAEAGDQLRMELQSLRIRLADSRFTKSDYSLSISAEEFIDLIEASEFSNPVPLTDEDWKEGFQHVSHWLEEFPTERSLPIGTVMVAKESCRLESLGESNHRDFKRSFENAFGDRISLKQEIATDLGTQILEREPERDTQLLPPDLIQEIEDVLCELPENEPILQHPPVDTFLDSPHALIEGSVPLAVVDNPDFRPIVLDLAKRLVYQADLTDLKKGRASEINLIISKLKLAEIDFPSPNRISESQTIDYAFTDTPAPDSSPEVDERQQEDLAYYDEAYERGLDLARLRAWEDSLFEIRANSVILHRIMGPSQGALYHLIDSFYQITPDLIKAEEFQICVPSLIAVYLSLVPPGDHPWPSREELELELEQCLALFDRAEDEGIESTFDLIIPVSRQKELLYAVLDGFERMLNEMPEEDLPENASEGAMYAVVATAVNVLDGYV